jgi:hypothetical protein
MNKDFFNEKVEGMKVTETLNVEMRPGTWKSYANIMVVYPYRLFAWSQLDFSAIPVSISAVSLRRLTTA